MGLGGIAVVDGSAALIILPSQAQPTSESTGQTTTNVPV